ncbi:MAG: DUF523 and DUF1722 domain-containing protein [Desulfobulbaceae bacterium]|nr:DUF523 and DUF1722 domain-containing protein [Desulfobulbaceae bacterium]
MNEKFPVPKVLISRCLGFAACRYDGQILKNGFIEQLQPLVETITVCPETDCGLGIPRAPIRLCMAGDGVIVYQPATGRDVTEQIGGTIASVLVDHPQVDGVILKSKSPSCGLYDTKIYQGIDKPQFLKKAGGVFGEQVLRVFDGQAIEDEMRLSNLALREHFLIKLFTLARFREICTQPEMGRLVDFHATHKLLFLAYNQSRFRLAGKIVANHPKLPVAKVFRLYREELTRILYAPLRIPGVINTLYHAFGWISEHLGPEEKQYVVNSIEEYRDERLPLQAVTRLLEAYAIRFGQRYLHNQIFLRPYPRVLAGLNDSGRGREVV